MNRLLALFTVGLVAGVAVADVPPPKGFKRVQVTHKITTEKDYPDLLFFTVAGNDQVTAAKLSEKEPLEIAKDRGGRFRACVLVAVPKNAGKKYTTEKEFYAAIRAGKVEGLVKSKLNFFLSSEVKDTDKRDVIVLEYKLDKIDAKEGIVLTVKKSADNKDAPEDDSDTPGDVPTATARAPRGGVWVAGLGAALALMLGGFWLAGRARRRV
jgi:hypothetical protein